MEKVPLEIQEQILWCLRGDPVTLHRVEQVCQLWADIVAFFEKYKALRFRLTRVLHRLRSTESFNESMSVNKMVNGRRCSGLIAERAEKVFLTHMEIIRLKYPGTLHALQSEINQQGIFNLLMKASRDILFQGIGVFLPYGADLHGNLEIQVSLETPHGKLIRQNSMMITKEEILQNAKMCIDHKSGLPLKNSHTVSACFPGPGQINHHRKRKRRCLGLHPYRVDFCPSPEILKNTVYRLSLRMKYVNLSVIMETPWGGGGDEQLIGEDGTSFFFAKDSAAHNAGSSVHRGQIPLLFYV